MRKAGAKEGSIGSKGAIDVNSLSVSTEIAGRPSDLMIKSCTCTGRLSSSSAHNLTDTYISMTCKSCTGESTEDRGGPSCSGKLNNMGLELPRPIDLEVKWMTVKKKAKGHQESKGFLWRRHKQGWNWIFLFIWLCYKSRDGARRSSL